MKAKVVKMCDMSGDISAKVFEQLNYGKVRAVTSDIKVVKIVTDTEPKDLTYPEGWYYANGSFRNKHMSTTGAYSEIRMEKSTGERWDVPYCTLDD